MKEDKLPGHVVVHSHRAPGQEPLPLDWYASDPVVRGPVLGSPASNNRNAIGSHSGSYALYRALAVASGSLSAGHKPDLTNTAPAVTIGPYPQWSEPGKIASLDPWGHIVGETFASLLAQGQDIRPTIAITRARLTLPVFQLNKTLYQLNPDGKVMLESGEVNVIKIAMEPVWHLPSIARRCDIDEGELRRVLFQQTGGMYNELVTRFDLKVFLPPIGGQTLYLFGELEAITDPSKKLTCRVHDECNGSDVFGSDICTCRPYLVNGIEECIRTAQQGGAGIILYNRKEGRALGEVTKFLVYNARKRQVGGDRADAYFERTECVAGVQDARFQELMPDPLHWLGVTRIDRFISMSNMKYDAIVSQGIEVVERIAIPDHMIPDDASVEMEAKKAAGYYTDGSAPTAEDLARTRGRDLNKY
jgi:GTP cyclohydrolase II